MNKSYEELEREIEELKEDKVRVARIIKARYNVIIPSKEEWERQKKENHERYFGSGR